MESSLLGLPPQKPHCVAGHVWLIFLWDKKQRALVYLWSHLLFCHVDEPSGLCAGQSWI